METKKEIIENLIRAGHVSLDQVLVLLSSDKPPVVKFTPIYPPAWPCEPIRPYYGDEHHVICKRSM